MLENPSYVKILNLGNVGTQNSLVGEVVVQEKLDGSQIGFGVNQNGELTIRSKGKIITNQCDKLFENGWNYINSIKDKILKYPKDTYFYGEYIGKPKHNVLKYDRTPKNYIVLFDCLKEGKWVSRETLEFIAKDLDIDVVPQLYIGEVTVDKVKEILTNAESSLGGSMIEGVVIKNYNQYIDIGGRTMSLFTKYVQEKFKEKHIVEWKDKKPKGNLIQFIEGFKSEARWEKAYQHLRDSSLLEGNLRDIPKLVKETQRDIEEEEKETIKEHLYKCYIDEIRRKAVYGLAEWLKQKLLNNLEEGNKQ